MRALREQRRQRIGVGLRLQVVIKKCNAVGGDAFVIGAVETSPGEVRGTIKFHIIFGARGEVVGAMETPHLWRNAQVERTSLIHYRHVQVREASVRDVRIGIGGQREDGFDALIPPRRPRARESKGRVAAKGMTGDANSAGIHGYALERSLRQGRVENRFDVVKPVAVGGVGPFLWIAERFFGPAERSGVPGASAMGVFVVGRQGEITGFRESFHQEDRLGVAAGKAMREQNQGIAVRGSSANRRPKGHIASRHVDVLDVFLRGADSLASGKPHRSQKHSEGQYGDDPFFHVFCPGPTGAIVPLVQLYVYTLALEAPDSSVKCA